MKTNQAGVGLIKSFEGLRLKSYLDSVGVPTIGYGHTKGVKLGQRITEAEAEKLLKADLGMFERGVTRLVTTPLNENQFAALVSFSFNVGLKALEQSTLLRLLNQGDYQRAANQLLRWNKAGGKVLPGLTRRRQAEKELFEKEKGV